jgi:FSR family fosmidomycin resistance protein-like MFS transporter
LVPWLWVKVFLIVLIKLVTLGWYEVLQGEAFGEATGRSGTVMAINSIIGLLGGGVAFLIGFVAARAGLQAALWILLAGPISLVLFVPKYRPQSPLPQISEKGDQPGLGL